MKQPNPLVKLAKGDKIYIYLYSSKIVKAKVVANLPDEEKICLKYREYRFSTNKGIFNYNDYSFKHHKLLNQ